MNYSQEQLMRQEQGDAQSSLPDTACYVYSGKCRLCDVGIPTGENDIHGKELFTGDILVTFTENYAPGGLTVMVSNQYQSYSDGTHKETGETSPYPMGIKNMWTDPEEDRSKWSVLKVKHWEDVVSGEHWRDFGFSFKST
jgi:hypothetical protein